MGVYVDHACVCLGKDPEGPCRMLALSTAENLSEEGEVSLLLLSVKLFFVGRNEMCRQLAKPSQSTDVGIGHPSHQVPGPPRSGPPPGPCRMWTHHSQKVPAEKREKMGRLGVSVG